MTKHHEDLTKSFTHTNPPPETTPPTTKPPKQYVWADFKQITPYLMEGKPEDAVGILAEYIKKARDNPEFIDVRFEGHYEEYQECSCDHMFLQGKRLETDEEYAKRIQDAAYLKQVRDEYDRRQYEALKKRFEGGK
jgi:hypothetical protein